MTLIQSGTNCRQESRHKAAWEGVGREAGRPAGRPQPEDSPPLRTSSIACWRAALYLTVACSRLTRPSAISTNATLLPLSLPSLLSLLPRAAGVPSGGTSGMPPVLPLPLAAPTDAAWEEVRERSSCGRRSLNASLPRPSTTPRPCSSTTGSLVPGAGLSHPQTSGRRRPLDRERDSERSERRLGASEPPEALPLPASCGGADGTAAVAAAAAAAQADVLLSGSPMGVCGGGGSGAEAGTAATGPGGAAAGVTATLPLPGGSSSLRVAALPGSKCRVAGGCGGRRGAESQEGFIYLWPRVCASDAPRRVLR